MYPQPAPQVPRYDTTALAIVIVAATIAGVALVIGVIMFRPMDDLITGGGPGPRAIGVAVSRTGDGADWQILVTGTPTGQGYASLALTLVRADGTTNLSSTLLASLNRFTNGCNLLSGNPGSDQLAVGDRIHCAVSWYPAGTNFQISNGATLLASGVFR